MDELSSWHRDAFFAEKYIRGKNQNGSIDKESHGEGYRRVDSVELECAPNRGIVFLQLPALDQGGVQVQIVRHDGRADDPNSDIHHSGLPEMWGEDCLPKFEELRMSLRQHEYLDEITSRNRHHQQQDHGLNGAHPEALECQKQKHIQAGDNDCP